MFRPMTPGVELAECIEQTQILVIVHARDIFPDRTALVGTPGMSVKYQ